MGFWSTGSLNTLMFKKKILTWSNELLNRSEKQHIFPLGVTAITWTLARGHAIREEAWGLGYPGNTSFASCEHIKTLVLRTWPFVQVLPNRTPSTVRHIPTRSSFHFLWTIFKVTSYFNDAKLWRQDLQTAQVILDALKASLRYMQIYANKAHRGVIKIKSSSLK